MKSLALVLLLLGPLGHADELIERLYRVDVPHHDVINVVREMGNREKNGEMSGYRQIKMFVDRQLVRNQVYHFGIIKLSTGGTVEYSDIPANADQLSQQLDQKFTLEVKGRKAGFSVPALVTRAYAASSYTSPNTEFVYQYDLSSGPQQDLGASARQAGESWRHSIERDQAQHASEIDQQRQVVDRQQQALYDLQRSTDVARERTFQSAMVSLQSSTDLYRQMQQQRALPSGDFEQHEISIYFNGAAQDYIRNEVESAFAEGHWPRVARMLTELESPLLTQASDQTREWLNTNPIPELLRKPLVVNPNRLPHFESPEFEHQKIAIANLLQTVAITRPNFLNNKAHDWVQAAAFLTEGARYAEAHGDKDRAGQLLEQAAGVAGFLAGDARGRQVVINGSDMGNFEFGLESGGLISDTDAKVSGDMITQAGINAMANAMEPGLAARLNPNKEFLPPSELTDLAHRLPVTAETRPYMDAMDRFPKITGTDVYNAAKIAFLPTVDFAVGLQPELAVVRDATEAITGLNFWTGQPLSNIERAIAVGGVCSLGIVSTGYKLAADLGLMAISTKVTVDDVAKKARELRDAKIDPDEFLEQLKTRVQAVHTVDEQQRILKEGMDTAEAALLASKPFGVSKVGTTYYSSQGPGPIQDPQALASFAGGKYTSIRPAFGEKFYRIQTDGGSYWTRVPLSTLIEFNSTRAVHPDWGAIQSISELTIPNTFNATTWQFYEGNAANLNGTPSRWQDVQKGNIWSGGGNLVYIPKELEKDLAPYIRTKPFRP